MIRPFIDAMSVQPTGGHAVFSDTPTSKPNSQAPPPTSQSESKAPPPTSQSGQSQGSNSPQSKDTEAKHDKKENEPYIYSVV